MKILYYKSYNDKNFGILNDSSIIEFIYTEISL